MFKLVNVTNPFGFALENFRFRKILNPYELFLKLRKNESFPPSNSKTVLVLPIRMTPGHLFEGLTGYALKLRGYTVHALFCGQAIRKCETISFNSSHPALRCSLCKHEQSVFADTFLIEKNFFSDFVDKPQQDTFRDLCRDSSLEELVNLNYGGAKLGKHVKSAVMRHKLISTIRFDEHEELIREFAFSTLMSFEATKKLIEKIKPEFVLASHDIYSTWGGAIEACAATNTHYISWGRGYLGGNIMASHNVQRTMERAIEPNEHWESMTLTEVQKDKIRTYCVDRKNLQSKHDFINHYDFLAQGQQSLGDLIRAKNEKTRFGLYPNIPWDGTTFSSSPGFPTIDSFMKATIDWFTAHPECELIIRAHPGEIKHAQNGKIETIKDVIDRIQTTLPDNIIFIDANSPVTSYEIESVSDYALVYASTLGLEFAYFGGTVIQTGQSNVSNKGIVYEAKTEEDYALLLEKAALKELAITCDMKERAEKYTYHWIYRRHIPDTTHKRKALTFTGYEIKSSMDLAPGKNKPLDFFLDCCISQKPFIWDE